MDPELQDVEVTNIREVPMPKGRDGFESKAQAYGGTCRDDRLP
jgi:hypothetical protein